MKRKRYSKEFKLEAVRLLETRDKSASALARELGVRRNQLYSCINGKASWSTPAKPQRSKAVATARWLRSMS